MASSVDICNGALIILGEDNVVAIPQDGSAPSEVLNSIYESRRDYLLRRYVWKFAKKMAILGPVSTTPAFDWTYAFNLPGDFLKLVKDSNIVEGDYTFSNGMILSNSSSINLTYIARITDVNQFDSMFRLALSALLARDSAKAITGKRSQTAAALYDQYINEAQFSDSIEQESVQQDLSDWELARL
jgi:hypothetical protein